MRTSLSLVLILGLLAGCGSGGGGTAPAEEAEVFKLTDDRLTLQPRTIDYRITGQDESDRSAPVPLSGSATIRQAQPEVVGGRLSASLERLERLDGESPRLEHLFSRREESENLNLQTGRRLADGSLVTWQTPPSDGPLRYRVDESWNLGAPLLGFAEGASAARLRLDSSTWSVDRIGIVTVPAGTFECYVLYCTERLQDLLTGRTDIISAIEYRRPDLGLIQKTVRIVRQEGDKSRDFVLNYEAESIR